MNDCIPSELNFSAWLITPDTRDALVQMEVLAAAMVANKAPVCDLRRAHKHYSSFLANVVRIMTPQFADGLSEANMTHRSAIVRAMLHRLNCLSLRFLSGLVVCPRPCCCNCPAAYDEIDCTSQEVKQVAYEVLEKTFQWDERADSNASDAN